MPLASSQPWFDCGETASIEGRWKGLSGILRKSYVPFLGEEATAMPPTYPTYRRLRTTDHRGDGGGCHSKLMVLGPGRADGPADLLEARGEIIDLQDVTRRVEYCPGVVPVHVPTARLGCVGERHAIHDPVCDVPGPVVGDALGNGGWEWWTFAEGDANDAHGQSGSNRVQGEDRVPIGRVAHLLDQGDGLINRKGLTLVVVRNARKALVHQLDIAAINQSSVGSDGYEHRPSAVI